MPVPNPRSNFMPLCEHPLPPPDLLFYNAKGSASHHHHRRRSLPNKLAGDNGHFKQRHTDSCVPLSAFAWAALALPDLLERHLKVKAVPFTPEVAVM